MNEAEKANQESDVYLKEVRLKNYKSIIDAEINFKPGLNIIIGNNGSGKTNFMNYLYDVVEGKWNDKQAINAEIIFGCGVDFVKIIVAKTIKFDIKNFLSLTQLQNQKKVKVKIFENDLLSIEDTLYGDDFPLYLGSYANYNMKAIQYAIPKEQIIVDKPIQLKFYIKENSFYIDDFVDLKNQSSLVKSIFYKLYYYIHFQKVSKSSEIQILIEELNDFFITINSALEIYTNINAIRISPNFNLYTNESQKEIDVHNFYFEFNVNDSWIPYSNLSDGSKRLFLLISETLTLEQTNIFNNTRNKTDSVRIPDLYDIILLEEPELGIHPHQLHKLMLFIKEQSKTKQIILTTHSPQVLNILDADELDRIIICNYDQQKGTQLRHLTEKEMQKARLYMQEDFLSDYWIHSDLEPIT